MSNEPHIMINGVVLTQAQAMTLRVTLASFMGDIRGNPNALGDDEHGRELASLYLKCGHEVGQLMLGEVGGMSAHDRLREERALAAMESSDIEVVRDALIGLQSTDHPSLLPLYERLAEKYRTMPGT